MKAAPEADLGRVHVLDQNQDPVLGTFIFKLYKFRSHFDTQCLIFSIYLFRSNESRDDSRSRDEIEKRSEPEGNDEGITRYEQGLVGIRHTMSTVFLECYTGIFYHSPFQIRKKLQRLKMKIRIV